MGKRKANRLSETSIAELGDGTHSDGGGLNLKIAKSGQHRSWVLRYSVDGKAIQKGLGSYPAVSLEDARQRAAAARQGAPPAPKAVPAPIKCTAGPSFRELTADVIDFRAPTWSNAKQRPIWENRLAMYAFPIIGDLPVAEITAAQVMDCLRPIWHTKSQTAKKIREYLQVIFDHAIGIGLRSDNPARTVKSALGPRAGKATHHRAIPYTGITHAMGTILDNVGKAYTGAFGLAFLILTAGRSGEVRGARWSEIDLDARVWTIPAERMKARIEHTVPLSTGALEIIEACRDWRGDDDLLFPNLRTRQPLSDMAFTKRLRDLEIDCVAHGFRSTFRTWSMEQPGVSWAACERALAHKLGGNAIESYARSNMLEQRRELMQRWCDYIFGD